MSASGPLGPLVMKTAHRHVCFGMAYCKNIFKLKIFDHSLEHEG